MPKPKKPTTPATISRRLAGLKAKRLGEALEILTINRLRADGCLCWPIATPMKVIGGKPVRTAQVAGDIMGITRDGRPLLVECKSHADGSRPGLCDFREGQRFALGAWADCKGKVIIAWRDAAGNLHLDDLRQDFTEVMVWCAEHMNRCPSHLLRVLERCAMEAR